MHYASMAFQTGLLSPLYQPLRQTHTRPKTCNGSQQVINNQGERKYYEQHNLNQNLAEGSQIAVLILTVGIFTWLPFDF